MTDRHERLEAELSGMQPRGLSSELIDRIESTLAADQRPGPSNRMLISAMCCGALAACVIVTVLLGDLLPSRTSRPVGGDAVIASTPVPRLGDASIAFARADARRLDAWW